MVKYRCQDCGDIQESKRSDYADENECECGGSYAELDSDDDEYEPISCPICKKEVKEDEDVWQCNECDNENVCQNCCVQFENSGEICIDCIKDQAKNQNIKLGDIEIEYREKIIEKPVNVYVDKEGTPIDVSFNPNRKSRFD